MCNETIIIILEIQWNPEFSNLQGRGKLVWNSDSSRNGSKITSPI